MFNKKNPSPVTEILSAKMDGIDVLVITGDVKTIIIQSKLNTDSIAWGDWEKTLAARGYYLQVIQKDTK